MEVVAGWREPRTLHGKAYLHHLRLAGKPVARQYRPLPRNLQSGPNDIGKKWSDAQENMARWKPWHD